MLIKEFMTTKLVSVTSEETIVRVARLMYVHKVRRLPVVDDGELVGIIGDRAISAALPSAATMISPREMSDTLSNIKVREIMHKDVITVTPDTTAESALDIAQEYKVGCLVVVGEKSQPVGIVTTNDFIYRILNPLLGLRKPGVRLHIRDCGKIGQIREVAAMVEKQNLELEALHVDDSVETGKRDLIVQVVTKKPAPLIDDLTSQGYQVEIRKRKSWPLPDEK
ncbi:MAG: CBS and ACT domain-containing protein [Dehalococcoidia bacterium]